MKINPNLLYESGSNTNGSYIKFEDGTMICWNSVPMTKSVTSTWGALYTSPSTSLGTFPQTFIDIPTITVYCSGSSSIMLVTSAAATTTTAGSIQLARADSNNNVSTTVNYIAIGKWK